MSDYIVVVRRTYIRVSGNSHIDALKTHNKPSYLVDWEHGCPIKYDIQFRNTPHWHTFTADWRCHV